MSETLSQKMATVPGIALPEGTPERPTTQLAYPAVHDMPPARPAMLLNSVEQQRLERDLVAARDRQQSIAGTPKRTAPPRKQEAAPAAATSPQPVPASSARSIY